MEHSVKYSNHAAKDKARTATVATTQMKATLIYLAPFLHPRKHHGLCHRAPSPAQTVEQAPFPLTTPAQHTRVRHLTNEDMVAIGENCKTETDIQTHVTRNNACVINDNDGSSSGTGSNSSSSSNCKSNGRRGVMVSQNRAGGSDSASSCCQNIRYKLKRPTFKPEQVEHVEQGVQKAYYENYEMSALETTPTPTTTTTLLSNIIKHKQLYQRQQRENVEVVMVMAQAQAQAQTQIQTQAQTNGKENADIPEVDSTAYYTNRSTKYLCECDGHRIISLPTNTQKQTEKYIQQQQQQSSSPSSEGPVKGQYKTRAPTSTAELTDIQAYGFNASPNGSSSTLRPLMRQQQQQQQTPCSGHCLAIENRYNNGNYVKDTNENSKTNNNNKHNDMKNVVSSSLSRCHCLNNMFNNAENELLLVKQEQKQQQQQQLQLLLLLLSYTHKGHTLTTLSVAAIVVDDDNNVDGVATAASYDVVFKNSINNSCCETNEMPECSKQQQQQQQHTLLQLTECRLGSNSYNLYKATAAESYISMRQTTSTSTSTNTTTTTTTIPSTTTPTTLTTITITTTTSSSASLSSLCNLSYTTTLHAYRRWFSKIRDMAEAGNLIHQQNCELLTKTDTVAGDHVINNKMHAQHIKYSPRLTQQPISASPSTSLLLSSKESANENNDNAYSSCSCSCTSNTSSNCWLQRLPIAFDYLRLNKTVMVSKWLLMWLLLIMLSTASSPVYAWAGRNDVPTNCTFPARWEGSWFLSGYQQSIHIKGSQFSYRGRCAASDGNKYLIVDEKGCHRCLVIYEKHKNVLQYKESECEGDSMYMHQSNPSAMAMRSVLNQETSDHRGGAHPNLNGHSRLSSSDQYIMRSNDDMNDYFCKGRETLQNLCDQIPGDALLYSLFRESAEPVKCPLKGPFIFTYNRGNGECKSPVSNIKNCTEDSRLLLSFQACPDVVGTESTVEELTCLATWKDGNSRYLVGLVSHHHAISNEERYRCFVYEKISLMDLGHSGGGGASLPNRGGSKDAEYKLAQSGDATCNGLDSAEVGSRIMSLRKPPVTERCDFPVWFKGPRHWHVLMGNAVYTYHTNDGSIHIIKPNGYMETRALCEQINKQTATEMMSVVHYTTGCQSGFMCMMFYRRDTHVIEIQTGKPASRLEDACAPDHFDVLKTPYTTLLASNPDPQICPLEGLYNLRGAIGPPYLTTRHKRNHNNKARGFHNHHHQWESLDNMAHTHAHKRHRTFSFRNTNSNEKGTWHSSTRGLPMRSRREANVRETSPSKPQRLQELLLVGSNQTAKLNILHNGVNDLRLRNRRDIPECITTYKGQRQLWLGCTEPNVIDVRPVCSDEGDEEYSCHGSWSENGTVFIIARHKGTKHGVCISYRPTEGTAAKLVIGDACYRDAPQKPPEHHLVANLSILGKCGETDSTPSTKPFITWLHLVTLALFLTCISQLPMQQQRR